MSILRTFRTALGIAAILTAAYSAPAHAQNCEKERYIELLDVEDGFSASSIPPDPLRIYQGLIYWQSNGLDAALSDYFAVYALESSLDRWQYGKPEDAKFSALPEKVDFQDLQKDFSKFRDALSRRKTKKTTKYRKRIHPYLPEQPPANMLLDMLEDIGNCGFSPEIISRIDTERAAREAHIQATYTPEALAKRAEAKAQADAEAAKKAARKAADMEHREINYLFRDGNRDAADTKMRDIFPDFMVAYDAAKQTQGLSCMPAAGPDATKAEVLAEYNRYHVRQNSRGYAQLSVPRYGKNNPTFQRLDALEAAYAIHLISRFGMDVVVDNMDILLTLNGCKLYQDKVCQIMRVGQTSYYHLMEYHKRREAGDMTPLDRSKVPLIASQTQTGFPPVRAENWKARYLGQCSLEHSNRDFTPSPAYVANNDWKNPTVSARECKAKYDTVYAAMTGSGSATDADVSWAFRYEKNKGQRCDPWPGYVPSVSAAPDGVAPPTLADGLESIARAAACTQQEYKCTYIGDGKESCTWVTKTVC